METISNLQVTLAIQTSVPEIQDVSALPIKVSVHNSADTPVTILKWGTPLDPQSAVLGVFEVCDTTDQRKLSLPTIKVSRKLPASEEDLVEIPPRETLNLTVNLPIPDIEKGHDYAVRAQGTWHAVWPTELSDVTPSQLIHNEGADRGEFRSNDFHVSV